MAPASGQRKRTNLKTALAHTAEGYSEGLAGLSLGCLRTLLQLGRPVLFLALLCLAAGASLSPVDAASTAVFLLAGCTALVTFVLLARGR
jgi:hypothetical protein